MLTALAAGAMLALVQVGHCASMCGPLSCAACGPRASALLRYQLGRICSYALLGALSGYLGQALGLSLNGAARMWTLALLTAGACLLSARHLLAAPRPALVTLRSKRDRPSLFARLQSLLPREPLFLGMLTAMLPCGVLASAVFAAVATGSGSGGAWLMIGFAAVSGSAVLSAGFVAGPLARRFGARVRWTVACALIVSAGLALSRPLQARSATSNASGAGAFHCH